MTGFDYAKMAGSAARLLTRFNQGMVTISRIVQGEPDPTTPWVPGEPTITTETLQATVKRVEQKFIDGTLIVGTEDQITFAVPSFEPSLSDEFTVDGKVRVLKDLRPLPGAGLPVAYIAFVAA
ncbi:hypothetical protein [Limoniibacter endophyticus]|uniref:Uncharacterized protein n=1 Tax=Limoniibacter endophyticus TaxID=1565040 RepID=A0A8J3GI62_9HYPH|nr:hypothetical protein [Limoniibacter endophyticus]GHC79408.1 hypothetical protein GCM10010136_31920 [Limoniibacter endophyticus]